MGVGGEFPPTLAKRRQGVREEGGSARGVRKKREKRGKKKEKKEKKKGKERKREGKRGKKGENKGIIAKIPFSRGSENKNSL